MGEFVGEVITLDESCVTGLTAFLGRPPDLEVPSLPDPAFVVLGLPETGQEILVEITQDMLSDGTSEDPDDPVLGLLNLGVVIVSDD